MRFFLIPWMRKEESPAEASADCIAQFLKRPEHRWILEDRPLRSSVTEFLSSLPIQHLREILENKKLLLLYCNKVMSASFYQYQGREVVLVFPELRRLLTSAKKSEAHAILAHELGHIYYGHSKKRIDPMTAQLEADRYAWEHGWGEEMLFVLNTLDSSEEVANRIQALKRR